GSFHFASSRNPVAILSQFYGRRPPKETTVIALRMSRRLMRSKPRGQTNKQFVLFRLIRMDLAGLPRGREQ
ncbi:hypothetical protein, partial [Schaalia turicensis]